MSPDKQQDLYARYPDLFRNASQDRFHSAMAYGITCDDGWFLILDDLCAELTLLRRYTGLEVAYDQIKEKLGGLRVYYTVGSFPIGSSPVDQEHWGDVVVAVVSRAEMLAAQTCEVSGQWGMLHRSATGWLRTLHPDVAAKDTERGWEVIQQ